MTVYSIIVTYNPELTKLRQVIASLAAQVDSIIVVKNSPEPLPAFENVAYIQLDINTGIAHAQNVGIQQALNSGADWILLSDQDTVYPDDYVLSFSEKIKILGNDKIYVPSFFNQVKNQTEPVSVSFSESVQPEGNEPVPVFHAIASGTLFNRETFMRAGEMSERLFIDYVDFEWCWRARSAGITVLCFPDIVINHNLGDSYKIFMGRKITVRSNFRYYYMLRNGFYLGRNCRYLNKTERKQLLKRTYMFAFGIFCISDKKLQSLKLIIKAMRDSKKVQEVF